MAQQQVWVILLLVFFLIPLLVFLFSALFKPRPGDDDEAGEKRLQSYWNRILWLYAIMFYGLFAVPATIYTETHKVFHFQDWAMVSILYVFPLLYIFSSIRILNIKDMGLLFIIGYDVCNVGKGIWFIPKGISRLAIFTTELQEYQFPGDSAGDEHREPIVISTGEKMYIKSDTTTGKAVPVIKHDEDDPGNEEDVLSHIIMLIVSPMVSFKFKNPRKLYQNFGNVLEKYGAKAVADEIARQIRDHIVSEVTAMFPQKTASAIFKELREMSTEILEKVIESVKDWGIEIIVIRLTQVNYDENVKKSLDTVSEKNLEAIGALIEKQKELTGFNLETDAFLNRAKELQGTYGEELKLILLINTAKEIAKGSTNYNVGNLGGLNLEGLLARIGALKTGGTP